MSQLKKLSLLTCIIFSVLLSISSLLFNKKIALGINLLLLNVAIWWVFFYIRKSLKYLSYILSECRKIIDEDIEHKIYIKGNGYFSKVASTINEVTELASYCINDSIKSEILKNKLVKELALNNNIESKEVKAAMMRVRREVEAKDIKIEKVNLAQVLNEAIKKYKDEFKQNNIQIKKLYDKPHMINANKILLKEAVDEMFENIYKHAMENTKAHVEIVDDKDKVYLNIKNIAKEDSKVIDVRNDDLGGIRMYENLLAIQKLQLTVENEVGLFRVRIKFDKNTTP